MAYPISDVTRRVVYTGSAGVGPYSFTFEVLANTDIQVYKNTTLLTLTTNYTVTINANGTGSVTLVVAATNADNITIVGDRAIQRATDFVTGGDLFANTLNDEFDSLVIFSQQVDEKADRGLKAPVTDPTDVNMVLPVKATRLGTVLAFNATTGNPEAGPSIASVTTVAAQSANINTVATNIASVNTVAGNNTNVTTVAGVSGAVTTVAGISANVTTVAGISSNVTTVATNNTNINTVAGVSANVTTVAGISANVTTVAGISGNVTTVAGISANVTTVAGASSAVTTNATNIASINTNATNIAVIQNASTNATNAANSATAAASSATSAANSATAAAASAASGMYSAVQDKSANYTVVAGDAGDLIRVTTTSGAVTITLPTISTVSDGFKIAIVKWTGDANAVTVARSSTNTINGATSVTIGAQYSQTIFVADFETDQWFAASSGLGTSNISVDAFSGDNSTVAFTLSADPGSENNTQVYVSGVYQEKDTYSVSGTTLTFSTAPPTGTSNIEVVSSAPLAIGTPSDGTVTTAKLASTTGSGAVVLATSPTITTPTLASANITTALTLTGASGTNGQALTSGGSGNAPTWTTIGASAATPTARGTVFGLTDSGSAGITATGWSAGAGLTSGANNVFNGFRAGFTTSSGAFHTFVGPEAGYGQTTGNRSVAVGYSTLYSSGTGSYIVAVGSEAAYSNTTDAGIIAIGHQALYSNTTGSGDSHNVAVGKQAMYYNTTGYYSAAVGYRALYNMTSGGYNTALGYQAGQGGATFTGSNLVSIGYHSGFSQTTASGNVFIGAQCGDSVTTGYSHVMIGANCGRNVTTGIGNIFIGAEIIASSAGVSNELVIAIANGQTGKGANTGFIAFGSGIYQGNNSSSWSTTSDQRIKKNIVDNTQGLDVINQIRVRNFEYRTKDEITELPSHAAIDKQGVQLGVIAQELKEVLPNCVKEQTTGVLSVDSDNLTWYMINAIKELKAELDALKAKVA